MLTGTWLLFRVAMRGESRRLPVTALVFVAIYVATGAQLTNLAPTLAERESLQGAVGLSGAFTLLLGSFDHPETIASTTVWRIGLFMAGALAVVAVMTVVRHTRAEEESGHLELVRTAPVGRWAHPAAGVLTGLVLVTVVTSASAVTLTGRGAGAGEAAGWAVAQAVPALVGIGLAVLSAQVATTARAASGVAIAVVLGLYVVRGVADLRGWDRLAAMTPFGWSLAIDPFGRPRGWPAAVAVAVAVVLLALAAVLARRRDFGAGLMAARPGRPTARRLVGPWTLTLRLAWRMVAGWAVVLALFGAFIASVLPHLGDVVDSAPRFRQMLDQLGGTGALVDAFLIILAQFFSVAVACWALAHLGSLRSQELGGQLESMLSTATSRRRVFVAHLTVALVGTVCLQTVVGVAAGTPGHIGDAWAACLVHLPAIWLLTALAALVLGARPHHWWWAWTLFVYAALAGVFGELLGLPRWVQAGSPFTHVPDVPAGDVAWAPVVIMTAVAVVVAVVAVAAFERRDVPEAAPGRWSPLPRAARRG